MVETGKSPEDIAKENGFLIVNDISKADEIISTVLAENAAVVEQYKNGETKVFGFLMGQCTKKLKESAHLR